MSYGVAKRIETDRQIEQFAFVDAAERARFAGLLPTMQREYLSGLMPVAVAQKHGFPVVAVDELFRRLETAEQLGLPMPYSVPEYLPLEFPAQNGIEMPSKKTLLVLAMIPASAATLFLGKVLLVDVLAVWVVAFAAGAAWAVLFIGKASVFVFAGWIAWRLLFSDRGIDVEKPAPSGGGQINIQITANSGTIVGGANQN